MSLETYRKPDLIYQLEDKPPFVAALIGAITHLLAIFVPMVMPALIVGTALKFPPEMTAYLISMAMVASGIGTFLQVNRFGIVGSGLLSIQSVNFSFVTVMISAGMAMKAGQAEPDFNVIISTLLGVSTVGAFLVIAASRVLPYLQRVITPTVSGIVVLMIGLSLIKFGVVDFGGGFGAKMSGTFGTYQNIGLATLVLVVVIFLNCFGQPLLRMGSIAIGLIVGYIVAFSMGMVDLTPLRDMPLVTIPIPFKYGFMFDWTAFLAAGTIYLLSVLEAVGDITATAMVSDQPVEGPEFTSRLSGGVLADGIVSVIACVFGSLPLTTFAQNNGVIQMTGVASRHVGKLMALILIVLGLFPIIGRLFATIPSPVVGGAMILMFAMIAIAGIRMIMLYGMNRREAVIVATSLGLGLGVAYEPELIKHLPIQIQSLVDNPICVGGLTGILLNLFIPQLKPSKESGNKETAPIKIIYNKKPKKFAKLAKKDK